tara:strand:+ start:9491 stop:9757 length:267 start_codon:yes stop_codon:yes gene_type:complete
VSGLIRLVGALALVVEQFVEVGGVKLVVDYFRARKRQSELEGELALSKALVLRDPDRVASSWDDWDRELQRAGIVVAPSGEDGGPVES